MSYLCVQLICGIFQSSGWPPVVAIVANWFGKGRSVTASQHLCWQILVKTLSHNLILIDFDANVYDAYDEKFFSEFVKVWYIFCSNHYILYRKCLNTII